MKATPDFSKIRADFPMLKQKMHGHPLIYLDSAATTQKPQLVIDTLSDFYQNHYGTVHRAIYELAAYSTQAYEAVREKTRRFLNAKKLEEIIFTRGTTGAINTIAFSFGKAFLKAKDVILVSQMEHHSNIVPWQMACEERGAVVKMIPMDANGELELDVYEKLLNENSVKLVALSHVANATGTRNPIKQMISMAHAKGAKVLVDGAQSAPHMAIDLQELDVDFFAFSGHKIYGPTGVGVLYGKEELLEQMPPYQGGGDMISHVDFAKTSYNVLPLKFEAGTPMIAEVIGLGAALDYVKNIGLEPIQRWEEELLEHATRLLKEVKGVRLLGTAAKKGPIICFVVDNIHPLDIGTFLDLRGIALRTGHHCAQPTMHHFGVTAACRASFSFYNTKEEITSFVQALRQVIQILSKQ